MGEPTAIYVRVSSKAQDTRSQLGDLKRWAEANGVEWVASSVYSDKFTGTTMERPGFNAMMDAVRSGLVKRVVVWRLDRLGRTAKGLITLFEDFQSLGVNLVSIRDNLDLSTPTGRLMANMVASFAAYETEVRQERQSAGIAAAKAAGKTWGGPVNTGKRLKVTPEQESAIRRMADEGATVAAMARATGLTRPTVYSVMGGPRKVLPDPKARVKGPLPPGTTGKGPRAAH